MATNPSRAKAAGANARKPQEASPQAGRNAADPRLDRDIEKLLIAANDIRRINMQTLDRFTRSLALSERSLDVITAIGVGFDRPSKLNKYFGIFPSAITAETDKLVEAGYITRSPDKSDRRVTLLALTESGQAVRREALGLVNEEFRRRLTGIPPSELERCIDLLRTIIGPLEPASRSD